MKDSCVPVKIVITTVLIKPWEEGVIRFVKYCSLCGVLCVTALNEYAILHWKRQHTENFVNVAVETTYVQILIGDMQLLRCRVHRCICTNICICNTHFVHIFSQCVLIPKVQNNCIVNVSIEQVES